MEIEVWRPGLNTRMLKPFGNLQKQCKGHHIYIRHILSRDFRRLKPCLMSELQMAWQYSIIRNLLLQYYSKLSLGLIPTPQPRKEAALSTKHLQSFPGI